MREALDELRGKGIHIESVDHPRVRALGTSRYLRLVQDLSALGVIKRGVDGQHYSPLRQNYRDGLDMLSKQSSAPSRPQLQKASSQIDMAFPETLRKFVTRPLDLDDAGRQFSMMAISENNPDEINVPDHPLLDRTKYAREFDEFSMLGKGGYGVVFHVKHKLDGGSYAIKKIPMGDQRVRRIQRNGEMEMDNILLELRTLARLNHPNVVRYHTGWIEYAQFSTTRSKNRIDSRKLLEAPKSRSAASAVSTPSIDIQFQFDEDDDEDVSNRDTTDQLPSAGEDDDQGIIFEESSDHTDENESQHEDGFSVRCASLQENNLEKMRSRSTLASVSDGVEFVPRYEDPTSASETSELDSSSFSDGENGSGVPSLALHIQMSLYSMTLADFLSPSDGDLDSSAISSLRHCFHPQAAFSMLLAIMDGTKYLHKEGIVHRDLKPGNVFLAVRPGTDSPPGAIDLSGCDQCDKVAKARPFNMDVCIGDFGLVSAIARAQDKPPDAPCRIVGTEIYRPEVVTRDNHPCLDVYALGIIAFELLWKFGTRMERHETLHKLKKGEFPQGFDEAVHCTGSERFIKSMVLASEEHCPSWEDLRAGARGLMVHY